MEDALTTCQVAEFRVTFARQLTATLLTDAITTHSDGSVYVSTGDIPAMWLRDSTAQIRPLLAFATPVPEISDLAHGLLRTQIDCVLIDPRANAFNDGPTGATMRRDYPDQSPRVFERKYAVDSLCSPLLLAWLIWRATGSTTHVDEHFLMGVRSIVTLWRSEQNHDGSYQFRRRLGRRRGTLSHRGRGAPVSPTGMTWSGFRPSDDGCTYGYNVPANGFAAATLERLADLLERATSDPIATDTRQLAREMRAAIEHHGIVPADDGPIYAYEVDGRGRHILLDDANVPSLLSLPYLGYCDVTDPTYQRSRAWILSSANPCWSSGSLGHGVGSQHTPRGSIWPLAIAMEGLTSRDADEKLLALERIERVALPLGTVPESFDPWNGSRRTRTWFSWAEMLYVELVLASAGLGI
jgi:meiotically up-regulated gene 157 (Mug157) protein